VFQGFNVAIEELEHEFLKREGENLHYDLYISFSEAVLGVSEILKQSMVK
jgi:molecular chaperone DnaJ